ncbi:MAG: hypothetical protein HOO91_03390 [Bacteroidales bacterium]|nr:hypothetical protein [Bacteroidales bacterium]
MGLSDLLTVGGGLEKLRITAFQDEEYKTTIGSFIVMYNPTTFSQTISTKWLDEKQVNTNGKEKSFRTNEPSKLTFDFMFDATCASPSSESKAGSSVFDAYTLIKNSDPTDSGKRHINDAIAKFFELTQKVNSETHKPSYLQINWGSFEFRGVLESATINYKLFNLSGLPIRATLTANFSESITKTEVAAEQKTESPDLTHYRIVNEGDTLPLLSQMMYGDPSYYMELAKINGLTNFRNIKVGQRIIFPPIDKSNKSK